jgi:hypothetical protein
MILIQRICIAFRGDGSLQAVAIDSIDNAAKEVLNWKARKFRILKNIPLPSAIACVIVVKSSSARTISAASLATSVPPFPIAIPMSAAWDPKQKVSKALAQVYRVKSCIDSPHTFRAKENDEKKTNRIKKWLDEKNMRMLLNARSKDGEWPAQELTGCVVNPISSHGDYFSTLLKCPDQS